MLEDRRLLQYLLSSFVRFLLFVLVNLNHFPSARAILALMMYLSIVASVYSDHIKQAEIIHACFPTALWTPTVGV